MTLVWSDTLRDDLRGCFFIEASVQGHSVGRIEIGRTHYRVFVDLSSLVNADASHAHPIKRTTNLGEAKEALQSALHKVAEILGS